MSTTAGSNQPKPMTPDEVAFYLADICRDLVTRREEILAGVARFHEQYPTIPDAEIQGRAGDFAGGKGAMAAFLKSAEANRVDNKQPFDRAANAVQTFFKGLTDPIHAAQKDIRDKMLVFANEQERIAREKARQEAERAAQAARDAEARAMASMTTEAFDAAAASAQAAENAHAKTEAKPAAFTRVSGSHTTVSVGTTWAFDEAQSNLMELVKAVAAGKASIRYLAFHGVNIGVDVRSNGLRELPGCTIKEVRSIR